MLLYANITMEEIIQKFKLFWQYPVITEKTFYEQNKNNDAYIGFPWATIIDKRYNLNVIYKILCDHISSQTFYYTCCQHISFRNLIPLFKALNINVVYSPHKIKGEDQISGIVIKPCPLYAVNYEDETRNMKFKNIDLLNCPRPFLYSFVGGYQNGYISNIRNNIFKLKKRDDIYIQNTGDWHFNQLVYHSSQNNELKENINDNHNKKTDMYNEILLSSRYSLCPSGSGPNSIRFWESLAVGSIPILLADTLDLPYHPLWKNSIIVVPEKNINNIDTILQQISSQKEEEMKRNALKLYQYYRTCFSGISTIPPKRLFTSYLCDESEEIIQDILQQWKVKNPEFDIRYFSDKDVLSFFKNYTPYYDLVLHMKNGVAKADFFRICYIQKFGGYWFDLDLEPRKIDIPTFGSVHLFDCGYKNISYMFIGGSPQQSLFEDIIKKVAENIKNQLHAKTKHVMDITGPRIIQSILFSKIDIKNKDGCFMGHDIPHLYLSNTPYEFLYQKHLFKSTKTNVYKVLQSKYKKKAYQQYDFI